MFIWTYGIRRTSLFSWKVNFSIDQQILVLVFGNFTFSLLHPFDKSFTRFSTKRCSSPFQHILGANILNLDQFLEKKLQDQE